MPPVLPRLTRCALGAALTCSLTACGSDARDLSSTSNPSAQLAPTPYTFRNVRIDGGGFVPGIVFSRTQKDLIYARTDIGGAYRWDPAAQKWVPLLDWVGQKNWGYNGVIAMATDPVDPQRVYAAVGMYTTSWDPNPGAILRSRDQGAHWEVTPLPFKLGGNMPGRGMGERLSIDPNQNGTLYFGAPSGNGLWRSTDFGVTWARVASFPVEGNYVADPSNEYGADKQGIVWITFDEASGSPGSATRTIYVGVADKAGTVYRSTDAGATWAAVPGAPTGFLAHKGVVDRASSTLYITTSDTSGPYDGAKGDVWKFAPQTSTWTRISPLPSDSKDLYFGYSGLTLDRQKPNTLMVATQISWWPDAIFFRTTDGGATWTRIWDFGNYPERKNRYKLDVSSAPWLTFGVNPQPPEATPKLGWMNESVEIDPFDSNRMLYGTGATIYGTTDLTKWDEGGQITLRPFVTGLEETAVLDLVSPPEGAPLLSALGDIGGFRHDDLSKVPAKMFEQPVFTSTTGIDFAASKPSILVRAGNFKDSDRPNDSHVAFSTDGGRNWFQGSEPGGIDEGGTVAASADGSRFVWAPKRVDPVFSVGFGNSWQRAEGLPSEAQVVADRVDAQAFYGFSGGIVFASSDGGAHFTRRAATGLPASGKLEAMPGQKGALWLAGKEGLFRSSDGGATFAKVASVDAAINVGFGKAAPGQTHPAVYLVGTVGGVEGLFRSDDAGATFVRLNDDQHQWGNMGEALTGDPRVYGRVYVGTNGRGIIVGEPAR